MKIEVKDNNIEQALRVLKRKLQRDGFFKVVKLKSVYEKPFKISCEFNNTLYKSDLDKSE